MTSWLTAIQGHVLGGIGAMSDLMTGKSYYRGTVRRLQPEASICFDKGLSNAPGANNCFLNAAVQVLWHIDVFRRSFRSFETHMCDGTSCIFCALKVLLTQFQHSELPTLPPDVLRQAMAVCYESKHRFKIGCMDDAAECLEKILEQIHYHLTGNENLDSCIKECCISHQKFALNIVEITICDACGATSEPLSFIQFIHYISSSTLVTESVGLDKPSFGKLIKEASYERRECSNVECKKALPLKKILLNCPDVVCIGMIWDSDQPSVEYITKVLGNIGTTLRTIEAFDSYNPSSSRVEYQLKAIVAYYGKHYSAYCFHSHLRHWVYLDDAIVKDLGPDWASASRHCLKAHYQPLLLIYVNPNGQPISGVLHPASSVSAPVGGTQETPNTSTSTSSTTALNTGPNSGPSAAPNTGPSTGSSTNPGTGTSIISSSELENKPAALPEGGNAITSGGMGSNGAGSTSIGGGSSSNGGGEGGNEQKITSSVQSNTQPFKMVSQQGMVNLSEQQEEAAAGRWSPSMQRKRPAAHSHSPIPSPSPGQHLQSQHVQPTSPRQQKQNLQLSVFHEAQADHRAQLGHTEGYSEPQPVENLIEFSLAPQQLHNIGKGGRGGIGGRETQQRGESGRGGGSEGGVGGGGRSSDPVALLDQTTLSLPSQSEDLMTFSVAPRTFVAPISAGPLTPSMYPTNIPASQYQGSYPANMGHGSAMGVVGLSSHPNTGYLSSTGSAANWSSSNHSMPFAQTGQASPQQLHITAQQHVPRSTSTQPIVPSSTSTQRIAPGSTSTQPIVARSTSTQPIVPSSTSTQPIVACSTSTQPIVTGSTSTQPIVARSTSTQPIVPSSTSTQPIVPGSTSTQPIVARSTSTQPIVPSSTSTQPFVPGSTSTQPFVPGSTSTQPFVPGSPLGHLNAQTYRAVSGTQPSTIIGFSSSGTKPVGQDTFPTTAGKSSANSVQPHMYVPTSSQQWASNNRPSPQQYGTSNIVSSQQTNDKPSQEVPLHVVGSRHASQTPRPSQLDPSILATDTTLPLMAPSSPSPTPHSRPSTTAVGQSPDVISAHNVVQNSKPQGLGSTIMRAFGLGSENSETRPQALNEQSRVMSSNQLAKCPPPYKQIDLHLIEDLPEGGKAAVYEALNRRAQAEALVGCDDVTSNLLYRQAATLLSALQHSPDIIHNDQIRIQITDCHQNIMEWLTQSTQSSCSKCGKKRRLDEGLLCGPCRLKEKKQSGATTYV